MGHTPNCLPIALIAILSIGVYANTLKNGFVFDDVFTIVDNPLIKDINNLPKLFNKDYFTLSAEITYRPVVTLTYFMDYAIYGLKPWGYHLTNILLHTINGVLLYMFLKILIRPPTVSDQQYSILMDAPLFASLFFVVHPILTEAVNGISFREDLLATLFYVMTLNLYLIIKLNISRPQPARILLYLLSCMSFSLALFAKEMAVTLPLIIFCYEWLYANDKRGRLGLIPLNPYLVGYAIIAFVYIYLCLYYFQNPTATGTLHLAQQEYFYGGSIRVTALTMAKVIAYYIKLLVLPINLCGDYYQYEPSYSFDSGVMVGILLIAGLLAAALTIRKIYPTASLGVLFFFLTLLPVSNVIPIKNLMAERYLYLPSIGFFLLLSAAPGLANNKSRHKSENILLLTALVVCFYALTIGRNLVWRDHYSFWSDTVKKMPGNSRAYYNLAMSTSDLKEKINALKLSLYLNPVDDKARSKLADAYLLEDNYQYAIKLYSDILRRNPDNIDILQSLAHAYFSKGDVDESKSILEKLVERHSNNPELLNDLGSIYGASREYDKAIEVLKEAIAISPRYLDAYYSLGITYREIHEFDKAIAIYNRALEMDPSPERAYIGLGEIYLEKENYPTAIEMYKKAINFNPTKIDTYYNIAYLYAIRNEFDSSLYWLKRGVDAGLKDIDFLKTDKVFTPLTGRVGFKELEHK